MRPPIYASAFAFFLSIGCRASISAAYISDLNTPCASSVDCPAVRNQQCNATLGVCECVSDAVWDGPWIGCRPKYCFELCTMVGYECHDDYCRLCWMSNNINVCTQPE